jgi:hypothetical protein
MPRTELGQILSLVHRLMPKLVQERAAESFQIVLLVGILHDRHLICHPGERDIGLCSA